MTGRCAPLTRGQRTGWGWWTISCAALRAPATTGAYAMYALIPVLNGGSALCCVALRAQAMTRAYEMYALIPRVDGGLVLCCGSCWLAFMFRRTNG